MAMVSTWTAAACAAMLPHPSPLLLTLLIHPPPLLTCLNPILPYSRTHTPDMSAETLTFDAPLALISMT